MKNFLNYLLVFSAVIVFGCASKMSPDELRIKNAPDAGPVECFHQQVDNYNLSLSSWKDSSDIKYFVKDAPFGIEKKEIEAVLDRAYSMWAEHIGKPIIRTTDSSIADILVKFDFLDGKGGTLGQSQFPPYIDTQTKPIHLVFDKYDVYGSLEGAVFDFFSIALHEAGHSLGLRHSEDHQAVMYYAYQKVTGLWIDDILGVRTVYQNAKGFTWGKQHFVFVKKENNQNASPNFKYDEYFTKCKDYTIGGHFIDSNLFDALQLIRYEISAPIKILSSYRTHGCNVQAGGAAKSQHLYCNAIDFKFLNRSGYEDYTRDITGKGCLFRSLIFMGVSGFGGYATSFHIDTRHYGSERFGDRFQYTTWGIFNHNNLTEENCEINL